LANTKSAIKRVRQEGKRRLRNRMVKGRMRTFIRTAQQLIAKGETDADAEAIRTAISEIDKAAQKGVIHPNQAARRKSRLMKRLNHAA
jgi:small subunit ribosomal protein S20